MRGCVTKRVGKRGVTWQVVVDLPRDPVTGKRRQKWLTAATKPEAEALARQTLAAIESGGFAEADAKKLTVSEYLTRWLETNSQTVRKTTQRRYEHQRAALQTRPQLVPQTGVAGWYARRLVAAAL